MKMILLRIWSALILTAFILAACQSSETSEDKMTPITIEGKTMGSYYRIVYVDAQGRQFQPEIEQLLKDINAEVNTYDPNSLISRFNGTQAGIRLDDPEGKRPLHFLANYDIARKIYEASEGYYDCTVMPLVNYWGFGYTEKKAIVAADSIKIDSLRQYVSTRFLSLEDSRDSLFLRKQKPGVQLDFSSCAQGYGTDVLAEFLDSKGIEHYLVDISGEQRARGNSPRGGAWQIGISTPKEGAEMTDIERIIQLQDRSLATSGNYRNFYEVNGRKYGHTINPHTGYPERTTLLSATILGPDCITVDALATACMSMGLERALKMIAQQSGVDAYFIYAAQDGSLQVKYTAGMKALFVDSPAQ